MVTGAHDEKIQNVHEQIKQLENKKKKLVQQKKTYERKARTRRLIERGAIFESIIDGAASLTNEQVKAVLEVALRTKPAAEMLTKMREQPVGG